MCDRGIALAFQLLDKHLLILLMPYLCLVLILTSSFGIDLTYIWTPGPITSLISFLSQKQFEFLSPPCPQHQLTHLQQLHTPPSFLFFYLYNNFPSFVISLSILPPFTFQQLFSRSHFFLSFVRTVHEPGFSPLSSSFGKLHRPTCSHMR